MQNKSKFKIIAILVIVLLFVIALAVGYSKKAKIPKPSPVYKPGTKIAAQQMPKDFPSGFPKEVMQEQLPLTHTDTVTYPGGKQDITVVYVSKKSLPDLFKIYAAYLPTHNWQVTTSELTETAGVLVANNTTGQLFVTIVPNQQGVSVTFLFKK